jgi:transcription elongation GreA/GreB family factor
VTVRQVSSGEVAEFAILGAWDSDPARNVISYRTSMAQTLLGKKENDVVEIVADEHRETWKIESIHAYSG